MCNTKYDAANVVFSRKQPREQDRRRRLDCSRSSANSPQPPLPAHLRGCTLPPMREPCLNISTAECCTGDPQASETHAQQAAATPRRRGTEAPRRCNQEAAEGAGGTPLLRCAHAGAARDYVQTRQPTTCPQRLQRGPGTACNPIWSPTQTALSLEGGGWKGGETIKGCRQGKTGGGGSSTGGPGRPTEAAEAAARAAAAADPSGSARKGAGALSAEHMCTLDVDPVRSPLNCPIPLPSATLTPPQQQQQQQQQRQRSPLTLTPSAVTFASWNLLMLFLSR